MFCKYLIQFYCFYLLTFSDVNGTTCDQGCNIGKEVCRSAMGDNNEFCICKYKSIIYNVKLKQREEESLSI